MAWCIAGLVVVSLLEIVEKLVLVQLEPILSLKPFSISPFLKSSPKDDVFLLALIVDVRLVGGDTNDVEKSVVLLLSYLR